MSDFINPFWSTYITVITVVSIAACALLLWIAGKSKVAASGGDNTTGHVWDEDLREMNNPLPMWWVGMFVITIVFAIAYLFVFPGLGDSKGQFGWSSAGQYQAELDKSAKDLAPLYARFASMKTDELARDPQAQGIGERLFLNNCAQCHGSDARGSKSFPNLADADWLHGGSPEKIRETIMQGRNGNMPPIAAAVGGADDLKNVAQYVLSLSGSPHDSGRAALGKEKFAVCAACHGADGKGNQALGAPNLTDNIWLHGFGEETIVSMMTNGKVNVMPAQGEKLSAPQIELLTAYIWGMSNQGGGAAPAAAAPAPVAAAAGDEASWKLENGVVKFYFASGKADVATGADKALAEVVAAVKGGKKATISGYHDASGDPAKNAELAKQRAMAVAGALKAAGLTDEQVVLQKPEQAKVDGPAAEARRVEVTAN